MSPFSPDPKPAGPARRQGASREFHATARARRLYLCACCGISVGLSVHHVFDRGDVAANYVMLCGDGVRGCHGLITRHDETARRELGAHVVEHRPDVVAYVLGRSRTEEAGIDWLERRLFIPRPVPYTYRDG